MPYIEKHKRATIKNHTVKPDNAGELNYLLTTEVLDYIEEHKGENGISYALLNEVTGVIESFKLEFYRRIVAPYEDEKIKKNGDVYDHV